MLTTPLWLAIAASAIVAGLAARRRAGWHTAALLLAFAALAGAWHHCRWSDLGPHDLARVDWADGRPAWLRGVVGELPDFRRGGDRPGDAGSTRTVLEVTGLCDGRRWHPAGGRVLMYVAGDRTDLRPGDPVEAAGNLAAIAGPLNPGEPDRRDYWRAHAVRLRFSVDGPGGVWADPTRPTWPVLRTLGRLQDRARRLLVDRLDPRAAPLAAALLLGHRGEVDPELNDAFARTGTTHLLAISGLHLQVLAAGFGVLLWLAGLGRKPAFATVALATIGYALLVGMMPSVVRSAAMTVAVCLGALCDRCNRPSNLLGAALLATLAYNPAYLFDVGCQLSFLAVAAIVWAVPPLGGRFGVLPAEGWSPIFGRRRDRAETPGQALDRVERSYWPWWRRRAQGAWSWLLLMALTSAVVWLAALPLVAWRFHLVGPIGVGLNLPLIPLTSVALILAAFTLVLASVGGPLAAWTAWACGGLLGWVEGLVRWGAGRTWGHRFVAGPTWGWVAAFYGAFALALLAHAAGWRPRRRSWAALGAATALGLFAAARPAAPGVPEAEVLAVGHGLAVVVQSADGRTLLYDCGQLGDPHVGRRVIAPALWSRRVGRIDTLVLSHADADHYNGLPDLLDRFRVGELRVPPAFAGPSNPGTAELLESARARGVAVRPIAAGDRLDLGPGLTIRAMHPPAEWAADLPDNARSVVLDVASGGRRLLLTGDLDGPGLLSVVEQPTPPIDALLAPHHGGRSANPPWFYRWAGPRTVLVSQRRPQPGTRDAVASASAGVPILRTWEVGAIRLRWTDAGLVTRGFVEGDSRFHDSRFQIPLMFWNLDSWNVGILPRVLLALVGVVLGLVLGATLAAVEWGAWALVRPGRRLATEADDAGGWEPLTVVAADGTTLRGAWLGSTAGPSGGRTLLLLHGFAEDGAALAARGVALAARGWDVARVDSRGRGASGGEFTAFGGREADDLRAWLDALAERAGPTFRAAAWGRSMGAAIALRAATADDRLRALVLEAPYADLRATLAGWLRRYRLPGVLAGLILRRANRLAGVPLDRPRPLDLAPRVGVPTLILAGADDGVAPPAEARRLAAAFPRPAELVLIPGARHADVFDLGGPDLAGRIAAFLNGSIGEIPAD